MRKTNLKSTNRLMNQESCCNFRGLLYNKTTLFFALLLLPAMIFAQSNKQQEKEVQHQSYLDAKHGITPGKAQATEAQSNRQISKEEIVAEQEYQNLLQKFEINEAKYFDAGFTKADILAEMNQMLEAGNAEVVSDPVMARVSGGANLCADAVQLNCYDDPINGDTFGANATGYLAGCTGVGLTNGEGVWFKMTGNGANNTVTVTPQGTFSPKIVVYSGACGALNCYANGTTTSTFFAAFEDEYLVYVTGNGSSEGAFSIALTTAGDCEGPTGDGLASDTAFPIACGDVATGSTVGAAPTQVGPFCGTTGNSFGVWYTFTTTSTQQVTAELCGSNYDTKINVYRGTAPGGLICEAGNDDSCGTRSRVIFTPTANTTYYIYVSGYNTAAGNYELLLLCDGETGPPPPNAPNNDLCPDASQLFCNTTIDGTTIAATTTGNPASCGGSNIGNTGVWYYYEGQGNQVLLQTCGLDTIMSVFTGSCGAFTCVTRNDDTTLSNCSATFGESQVSFFADAGVVYTILVTKYSSSTTAANFTLTTSCTEPVSNDTCDNASPAECGDEIFGSTTGATSQGIPDCGTDLDTAPGVWYEHVGTGELLTISTAGSDFDTKLGLFTGSCDALVCVAGNDDANSTLQSEIRTSTVLGQTYYIYVTGFLQASGEFLLTLDCQPDPCTIAEDIACGETATGTTLGGSTAGPTGSCGVTPGSTGVYYRFVGTGEFVTASLCNSSFDTLINVYQGECGAFACITGNDDACGSRSEATFFANDGEAYHIWISGFGGATGDYELTMTCSPPVSNDLCEDALPLGCDATVTGSTTFSTDRDRPGSDCSEFNQVLGQGVWYTLVGTGGEVNLSLCNSTFDTKLLVFTGTCGDLTCYAGNDDNSTACGPGFRSELQMPTTLGELYYIYVTGYTYTGGPETGDFTLEVNCLCIPGEVENACVTVYDGYDPASTAVLTGELLYGEEPISYSWSNGATSQSIVANAADGTQTYTVVMTDATGCSASQEFFVYSVDVDCDRGGSNKVEICHNGNTICVNENAVASHLNHGDSLGACGTQLCDEVPPVCDVVISSPANGATDVSVSPAISWSEASGLVDGYNVIISSGGSVIATEDAGNVLSHNLTTQLAYETGYTVTVVPYNANGPAVGCSSNSFTTMEETPLTYCTTGYTNLIDEWISRVELNTIDNPSGSTGYSDFTAISTTLTKGSLYNMTVTVSFGGSAYSEGRAVYIDYNRDGDFDDAGEQVWSSAPTTTAAVSGSFTVPNTALEGATRMRVQMRWSAIPGPCENTTYGEAEDYTVNIVASGARVANQELDWNLYPNPSKGQVNLDLTDFVNNDIHVQVIDLAGNVVLNRTVQNLQDPKLQIELKNVPFGMYFVRVQSNSSVSTKRLIINN